MPYPLRPEDPFRSLDLVPPTVRAAFPGLELPEPADVEIITSQMGKLPQGRILVTCRCPHGMPAVILTLPFESRGGPAPPLIWLCCPHAAKKLGTIESSAGARSIAGRLEEEPEPAARFEQDERQFEALQVELARAVAGEAVASRVVGRGVAGGSPGAIKCLHAHLAYRLSVQPREGVETGDEQPGIVGLWCQRQLEREGGNWCERPPAACVP